MSRILAVGRTHVYNEGRALNRVENIAKLLREGNRFLITTHAMPDGDGLGSEMALHGYLKQAGRQSFVVNTHPTPEKFQLVDPDGEIRVFSAGESLPSVDTVIVVDTNDSAMLGPLEGPVRALGVPVAFLDHHVPAKPLTPLHLIDESFSSTGELVFSLLRHLEVELGRAMALSLYVALVTDTHSFRFKRTSPQSHRIAAELLSHGISAEEVYRQIYARDSFAKIRLFGHVLEGIRATAHSRVAWLTVTRQMREHYQATIEDTEAFVNQLTLIEGVTIGILFREEEDGSIKVSLRGNHDIPVFGIAKHFGGGGHRFAAGIRMEGPLADVVHRVVQAAVEALKK